MVGAIYTAMLAGALSGAATPDGCTAVALPIPGAAQAMVSNLNPGQTGCLAAGVHAGGRHHPTRPDHVALRTRRAARCSSGSW